MTGLIEKVTLPEHEMTAAAGIKDALHSEQGPSLRTAAGHEVAIPRELAHMFEMLASAAANGQEITVTVGDPRLRPREAAAALGMSRTHLCTLMDQGDLAFDRVGTHRRIAQSEVERYRALRADRVASQYAAATNALPDVADEPMQHLPGPSPKRPGR